MRPLPRDIVAIARSRAGLLTVSDLRPDVSSHQRQLLLASGDLITVHKGVYRLASHEVTFEQRCLAACLAAGDASLSGPTLGRIMGLRKCHTDDVHIIAKRAIELEGVVAHRTTLLRDADRTRRGPLNVLRPARLVCDLARFLDDADLESVIEQVLDRRLTTLDTVRHVARDFMASGRDGTRRIARVLDARPSWRRPAGSDLEVRLQRELSRLGLDLIPQVPVVLDDGRRIVIDLADPALRFGIEVDHATWHGGRLDAQRDKARDRALCSSGGASPASPTPTSITTCTRRRRRSSRSSLGSRRDHLDATRHRYESTGSSIRAARNRSGASRNRRHSITTGRSS